MQKKYINDLQLKKEASELKNEIYEGIETYAITKVESIGDVYAYETDGYGMYNLMDDSNVPSLLAMDYIGYQPKNPTVAENTRKMILSKKNPYYYEGKYAKGMGSPHTPPGYIWHIGLALQGLTSKSEKEKWDILELMKQTDGNTGLMHEGFDPDDPTNYTREWFSWANAMFCELLLDCLGYKIEK